jgi:hypothetical protein
MSPYRLTGFQLQAIRCLLLLGFGLVTTNLFAQRPYEGRHLVDGNMAPGQAAHGSLMADPSLLGFVQPVRVIVPNEARLEIGNDGAYVPCHSARVTAGMMIGPVYRFKVTAIPGHPNVELFPSIEILGRLHPPLGLETKFPIQVNLLQDDLDRAIQGSMVTKVVYLENPDTAFPHRHVEDHQPYFDLSPNEDPIRAAERLGRPMAIVRIGSRIPTSQPNDQGFDFNSPAPIMLDDAEPLIGNRPNTESTRR